MPEALLSPPAVLTLAELVSQAHTNRTPSLSMTPQPVRRRPGSIPMMRIGLRFMGQE